MATACLETVVRAGRTLRKLQRDERNAGGRLEPLQYLQLVEAEKAFDALINEPLPPLAGAADGPVPDGNRA